MFGPLPALHRMLLVAGAVVFFVAVGAWLGAMPTVPLSVTLGIAAGVALGAVAAGVILHQSHAHPAQPARARRRHH